MTNLFNRIFVAHPKSVGESYLQHMAFAGWFASRLLFAGMAALIHAGIPSLFEATAGNLIKQMHARLTNRHDH